MNCKKSSCYFTDILAAAGLSASDYTPPSPDVMIQRRYEQEAENHRRAEQARRIWIESIPIIGTPAETYLQGRGITCDLPNSLRFHGACWHGATAKCYPAMIAAVTRLDGSSAPAVHRTYLRSDGSGKADISPAKAMLGSTAGGGVKLSSSAGQLVVCEGIETGLSLVSGGLCGGSGAVVAALSTSGIMGLVLPLEPGHLILAPDGDEAGREAVNRLGERALLAGWRVDMLSAPDGFDFNDVLMGRAA
jgi:hypothetical protein